VLLNYLFSRNDEISVKKLEDHAVWLDSYKKNNKLFLDKGMTQRLFGKNQTKDD